eukprot:TRINITY_DN248_c5_g1_i1.p1 TRINITY_DN248_c5_g1~~TRINITY_DN248_c5_g1_i1.p1  ORF type:complete len:524 (+),score=102.46 TRINITY_DN248_c5_g1_i1:47-1618(+)
MKAGALILAGALLCAAQPEKPNIVFFLTDDQDQKLGGSFPMHNGVGPMPVAQKELVEKGAMATNWFIHTPICCPSRSELVSGRYFHNIKKEGLCPNGHAAPSCCMHVDEDLVNNATMAKVLKEGAGYTVGIFGKYLNSCPDKAPEGFDAYFANGGGDYFSPSFAVEGVEGFADGMWHGGPDNYTTSVVGNVSNAWIKRVANGPKPFFAYIAPKACHEPFTPAPWYADHWDPAWPPHEPRPVSWNCSFESRADHHYTIRTEPMITEGASAKITQVFQDRWRTLMSVDDVIKDTMALCEDLGIMDKTYFFYSSDHGFQLGEFNLPFDKRHVYEFDIRIHLLVRGPGITAGSTFETLGSQVDLAPTWLGLAGLPKPANMDGKSILPFILHEKDKLMPATKKHLDGFDVPEYTAGWRDSMFIEYYYNDNNTKCIPNCYNIEDASNNYIGIRHLNGEFGDTLYSEFQTTATGETVFDNIDFYEYYNVSNDPWQMDNIYNSTLKANPGTIQALHNKLRMWFKCAGESCP